MADQVTLLKPTVDLRESYLSFYKEWKDSGELIVPWVVGKDPTDFEAMVQFLLNSEKGVNLPEGWVPDSTYWLADKNNRILGAVNIRHQLTDKLLESGGHIGYGIRPSERQKGYATKLLSLALEKLKEIGVGKALITCDENNLASAKVIIKNGGMADYDFVEEDGKVVKRFWIQL
jgi:predicted acetyltransferase